MLGICWPAAHISTCVVTLFSSFLNSLSVVSVDKINLEAAISENGKDLFYTIDDVFGSSFVRCTCCFCLAFADTIKSLSCVEFDFGRFNEKVGCALNIKEIDVKIF